MLSYYIKFNIIINNLTIIRNKIWTPITPITAGPNQESPPKRERGTTRICEIV